MAKRPFFTVCIPAYNRPEFLGPLLDTVLAQDFRDYELLILEDCSPKRAEIRAVAENYRERFAQSSDGGLRYEENENNLGYDGNLRRIVERSRGRYCFFMGNDDLMCPGALRAVAEGIGRHTDIGVMLRSYAAFDGEPTNVVQEFRYFPEESFFPAGSQTIATFFRRSVVIPGMVIHRDAAHELASQRFDGTLLYQQHLVGQILRKMNGLYLPRIIVLYRNGGTPDFGNSAAEKGKFKPTEQTPESSIHFVDGMFKIARSLDEAAGERVFPAIFRDIGNYSYPILAIQARRPIKQFLRYGTGLARLGLWKSAMFWVYLGALTVFGPARLERLIVWIKKRLGLTPVLGRVYQGKSLEDPARR